jgi:putative ABC transport system substrate-binding protein
MKGQERCNAARTVSTIAGIVLPELAIAETPQRLARIGWVTAQQASSLTPYVEAFRSGLADLGYVEGRDLILVLRYGDDNLERVPEIAAELVRYRSILLFPRAQPMCW